MDYGIRVIKILSMKTDERILQCIYNINNRVSNIQDVKLHRRTLNLRAGDPVEADLMFFSIVKICSILDEMKILNVICKDDNYLKNCFYCIAPLTRYIKQYEKGFEIVRNGMVAHFNRDKQKKFKPAGSSLNGLIVPRDNREWEFIYDCLDVMRAMLIKMFSDYTTFHSATINELSLQIYEFKNTFQTKDAVNIDLLKKEIDQRLKEKDFKFNFSSLHQPSTSLDT